MKNIVVGIDQSERSEGVLQQASAMAEKFGAKLHVVRAVPLPAEIPFESMSIAVDALPERLRAYAQASLDKQSSIVGASMRGRVEARVGTPWQVICDTAKELDADCIVIGTHGYNVIDRIIGTTAARVVNHAPCSVFVVRNG